MAKSTRHKKPIVVLKRVDEPQDHRTILSGRVFFSKNVQVLVFSHDGVWYLQKDAKLRGTKWKAECCYGFEDSGGLYQARAVAGARLSSPTYASLDVLPEGTIVSNEITIERKPLV